MKTQRGAKEFTDWFLSYCPNATARVGQVKSSNGEISHSLVVQFSSHYAHYFVVGSNWHQLRVFPDGSKTLDDLEIRFADKASALASILFFQHITASSVINLGDPQDSDFAMELKQQCLTALKELSVLSFSNARERKHAKFLLANL